MEKLTLEKAKEINASQVTEEHLILHAANVSAAMGAMAEHFGEDKEHWEAVGYLHDFVFYLYGRRTCHQHGEESVHSG